MNEREKLIKLLDECIEAEFPWDTNDYIADHLLSSGVLVPPCKLGDTVYLIPTCNGKPYCGVVTDKVQMIGITSRGIHIKARNHHDYNKMYMLGKTVFLTREESERALKGGAEA